MSEAAVPAARPAHATVEALLRDQLARALGGRRGIFEAAVPTIAFTLTWVASHRLVLAVVMGLGSAVAMLVLRLVRRQTVQFVLNSLLGIGIGAVFALRSGQAADAFLPGIITNAVYAVGLVGSVLARWPLMGLLVGGVTGDLTGWRANPDVLRLTGRLTLLLAIPCVARVAVQYPLFLAGQVGWLGVAKVGLGWPLQVAALAGMVYLLAAGHTPLAEATGSDGGQSAG